MMGRTHKSAGLLVASASARLFVSSELIQTVIGITALVIGGWLGSLICDIDKKESTIGRYLWFISWPIYLLRLIIRFFAFFSSGKLKKVLRKMERGVGHRGLAHSLITWATLSICFLLVDRGIVLSIPSNISYYITPFLFGVSIGMLSHIFLDLFNGDGEALLYPFIDKKIGFADIKLNGITEHVLRLAMQAGVVLIAYRSVTPKILSLLGTVQQYVKEFYHYNI